MTRFRICVYFALVLSVIEDPIGPAGGRRKGGGGPRGRTSRTAQQTLQLQHNYNTILYYTILYYIIRYNTQNETVPGQYKVRVQCTGERCTCVYGGWWMVYGGRYLPVRPEIKRAAHLTAYRRV